MKAGDLRHVLLVESYGVGADGTPTARGTAGGVTPHTWTTFATIRAAIFPLSGDERVAGEAYSAQTTHKVVARYLQGITSKMRITDACGAGCPFAGVSFDITGITLVYTDGSNRREMDLQCRQGRSHGSV